MKTTIQEIKIGSDKGKIKIIITLVYEIKSHVLSVNFIFFYFVASTKCKHYMYIFFIYIMYLTG